MGPDDSPPNSYGGWPFASAPSGPQSGLLTWGMLGTHSDSEGACPPPAAHSSGPQYAVVHLVRRADKRLTAVPSTGLIQDASLRGGSVKAQSPHVSPGPAAGPLLACPVRGPGTPGLAAVVSSKNAAAEIRTRKCLSRHLCTVRDPRSPRGHPFRAVPVTAHNSPQLRAPRGLASQPPPPVGPWGVQGTQGAPPRSPAACPGARSKSLLDPVAERQ
ncbi:hypothetical protein NDU88_011363 [Pleurodeles waltl]|uniref:Uncharacterized protein n=1 Tax=Pleurodeles waltl TaxID=8319 RepID=A0AAV7QX07_PLEWA|nr:hypothetical protein NDU88_011363 [Pleurodeles waltl]